MVTPRIYSPSSAPHFPLTNPDWNEPPVEPDLPESDPPAKPLVDTGGGAIPPADTAPPVLPNDPPLGVEVVVRRRAVNRAASRFGDLNQTPAPTNLSMTDRDLASDLTLTTVSQEPLSSQQPLTQDSRRRLLRPDSADEAGSDSNATAAELRALQGMRVPTDDEWAQYYAARSPRAEVALPDVEELMTRNFQMLPGGAPILLHRHQAEDVLTMVESFQKGWDRALGIKPTRTGKTYTFLVAAKILNELCPEIFSTRSIVVFSHTRRAAQQVALRMAEIFGPQEVALMMGGHDYESGRKCASVVIPHYFATSPRPLDLAQAGIVVVDETHHLTYGNRNLMLLVEAGLLSEQGLPVFADHHFAMGWTGTLYRLTKEPIRTVWGRDGLTVVRELEYYLDRTTPTGRPYLLPAVLVDHSASAHQKGEPLWKYYQRVSRILRTHTEDGEIPRTLVYIDSIRAVRDFTRMLWGHGIRAVPVHSDLSVAEVESVITQLNGLAANRGAGRIRTLRELGITTAPAAREYLEDLAALDVADVIVNDEVYGEAMDDPRLRRVVLMDAIRSFSAVLQKATRGATVDPDNPAKTEYEILDFAGNINKHRLDLALRVSLSRVEYDTAVRTGSILALLPIGLRPDREDAILLPESSSAENEGGEGQGFAEPPHEYDLKRVNHFGRKLRMLMDASPRLHKIRLSFATDIGVEDITQYYLGVRIPENLGEVRRLAGVLKDDGGELVSAWVETRLAIESSRAPVPYLGGDQALQTAAENLVRAIRTAYFLADSRMETLVAATGVSFGKRILFRLFLTNLFNGSVRGEFAPIKSWQYFAGALKEAIASSSMSIPAEAVSSWVEILMQWMLPVSQVAVAPDATIPEPKKLTAEEMEINDLRRAQLEDDTDVILAEAGSEVEGLEFVLGRLPGDIQANGSQGQGRAYEHAAVLLGGRKLLRDFDFGTGWIQWLLLCKRFSNIVHRFEYIAMAQDESDKVDREKVSAAFMEQQRRAADKEAVERASRQHAANDVIGFVKRALLKPLSDAEILEFLEGNIRELERMWRWIIRNYKTSSAYWGELADWRSEIQYALQLCSDHGVLDGIVIDKLQKRII